LVEAEDVGLSLEKLTGTKGKMLDPIPGEKEPVTVLDTAAGLDRPGVGGDGGVLEVVVIDGAAPDLSANGAEEGSVGPGCGMAGAVCFGVAAGVLLASTYKGVALEVHD
jgi:hypothetical protein